jgi:hypothetical protein
MGQYVRIGEGCNEFDSVGVITFQLVAYIPCDN